MKILSNFDTALDQQFLKKGTIIIKKHPFFLFQAMVPFLLFLVCYAGEMYLNLQHKGMIGTYINALFSLLFLFWFWKVAVYITEYLRNFRKLYHESDRYLLIENDHHFDRFLKMSFFVIGMNMALTIGNIVEGWYLVFSSDGGFTAGHAYAISLLIGSVILNLGMVVLQIQLFKKCIDLEMDFCAVSKEKISYIDQSSFLVKKISEVRYDKVTNISTDQKGFLHSLFDYGNILIFTEGEDQQEKTMIAYVKSPTAVRSALNEVFEHGELQGVAYQKDSFAEQLTTSRQRIAESLKGKEE